MGLRTLQNVETNISVEIPTLIAELPTSTSTPLPIPTHTSTSEPTATGTLVVPPTFTPTTAPVSPAGLEGASVSGKPQASGGGEETPMPPASGTTPEAPPISNGIPVSGGVLSPENGNFLVLSGAAVLVLIVFGAVSRRHRFG